MEEMLSNVAGARQIFERWMEWEPDEQAWHSYINMELRYKETDRARNIYERYVMVHPEVKNWVKYAKFEERQSNIGMEYSKETPLQGGRGRFLNKNLILFCIGRLHPVVQPLIQILYYFWQKMYPILYTFQTNGTPFTN